MCKTWAALALILFFRGPANAQLSGRISGSVVDATGSSVPGADVRLYLAGGKKPLLSTKTSSDGLYNLLGVRPADYDVEVEAAGFVKTTLRAIVVDAARETPVPQIKLELAAVSQSLEVSGATENVAIDNAEISDTITTDDIRNLPVLDRDPLGLLQTQPGVVSSGNSATVINGLRTSFSNMTLDGINIQDNYLRDNALDYTPNKLLLGQVRQMTMVNANANAAAWGGATQAAFSTPSGGNVFHGDALWENRNSHFAANDWFSNQSGTPLPRLNQNQFGGSIGGPIQKDKFFFFFNYEAVRVNAQTAVNTTILTSDARNGIFTYKDTGGTIRKVNLLRLRGINTLDPVIQNLLNQVPTPDKINNFETGDSTAGLLKNTAGYRFNQRSDELRDNLTGKLDYNLSTRHALSATYAWNRDNSDRPDSENDYALVPKVTNPTRSNLMALNWRWTPTATLTNELRGGFNLTWGYFETSQQFGPYLLTGMIFNDPVNEALPQGRTTNTYNLSDDAAYQHGRHYIQFGYSMQQVRVASSDSAGTLPAYNLFMGVNQPGLAQRDLPGVSSSTDLDTANALLASLGGYIDSASQTFQVASRNSGFVPGAPYLRHFLLNDYSLYVSDRWKVLRTVSLTLGLRYNLPGVMDESSSLELQPAVAGGAEQTLLSNATLNFAGGSIGKPYYHRDYREFAPNVGLAWDVFGNGRTAFRAGYSISYVNDQAIYAPESMLEANAGLSQITSLVDLSNRVPSIPAISAPPFQVPLQLSDNYANNPLNTAGLVDPNLRRPRVQQWSAGIQHQIKNTVFEARYVGNHMTGGYRAFDFNQVVIRQNGFLNDFLKAQNNGFLSQNAGRGFLPAYNPSIPGSQPLTVFPKLFRGGLLTDATIQNLIQTGQAGELASVYQINGLNGSVNFFQNPYTLGADMLTNFSSSSYNGLQLVARQRLRSGLSFEANYTYSKVLSDADGDSQSRIQHFLDLANPGIERSRANFDLTHMIKAYGTYELPFGKGHRLHLRGGSWNRVVEGWKLSGNWTWQSGAPFSILSQRGTLNRASGFRSQYNTADTALTKSQLDGIVGFYMTGNGPSMIAQSAINQQNGTGVNNDGSPAFNGQAFFNPGPGTVGVLQRRLFDGPWVFSLDASLVKTVVIREQQTLELRMDAFNLPNHTSFFAGDQNINSPTFGVVAGTFGARLVQFGVHYRF
ncbi:MAG TPA: TonB-dependent receptor [Bryobacteraceae bacterium]|nr:TonB-dependent receptor [Bryobacteraceae bacterium]